MGSYIEPRRTNNIIQENEKVKLSAKCLRKSKHILIKGEIFHKIFMLLFSHITFAHVHIQITRLGGEKMRRQKRILSLNVFQKSSGLFDGRVTWIRN